MRGSLPKNAAENVVLWKGSVMRRLRDLRVVAEDLAITEQFNKLQQAATLLSYWVQLIPTPEKAEKWRERLAQLTTEKEQLEAALMGSSAFAQAVKPIAMAEILAAIPADCVLVDFLEFNRKKNDRELLATVLTANGEAKMLSLGSVKVLHEAVDVWRDSFGTSLEGKAAGQKTEVAATSLGAIA